MQETFPANRGQVRPRLAPIHVPPLHQRSGGGRPPATPVVVQQHPAPPPPPPPPLQGALQMQRPVPHPAGPFPPHPPREIIPLELHRSVVVSDTRPEAQTESDIREYLSDYIILRFEKIQPYDEYDSEGEPVKATWDNCIRRRLADFDKADTRREIRRLNKEDAKKGRTLLEKQNALGPKGQNQLAKAQRELSSEDRDERFQIRLAQVDSTLKPVIEKHERVTRHRRSTKRKIRQKKRYERSSITAYFKRYPKPSQLPSELARQIELDKQLFRQQQQAEMRLRQHQMQQQQMYPPHPQALPRPQDGHMDRRPPAMPMHQHNAGHGASRPSTPIQVTHEPRGKDKHHKQDKHHKEDRSRSSGSSSRSAFGSDSDVLSGSTVVTEPSRSSGSDKGMRDRGPRRDPLRYLEKAASFNVEVHPARRHSLCEGKSYIVTRNGTRISIDQGSKPPREADTPAEDLDKLRAHAYHAGRSDQQAEYRQIFGETGSVDTQAGRYQPRYAVQPEVIIEHGAPGVRHVTTSEVDRQLGDKFQRLRLGRESRYHDEPDHLRCCPREIHARVFQEQGRGSLRPMVNPFSPQLGRRPSAYEFERGYRK